MQKIKNIIRLALSYIYFPFLVTGAKKKIKKILAKQLNIADYLEWVEKFKFGPTWRGLNINFKPGQIKSEIKSLLEIVSSESPKIIVEIGTASGGTLFLFTRIAQPETKIVSIDLPFGKFGAGYLRTHTPLLKEFATQKQELYLLRANSHSQNTLAQLKEILGKNKIDFLFIDGDHTYEGVSADFKTYKDLVRPGGIIAFHDIVKNILDPSMAVWKFWQEIKNDYSHKEFIDDDKIQHGCGIGLIYLK